MKKLIRIDFALKNPQQVIIYGYDEDLVKREIGCIFTPAGSGEYIINGIQVCGFREAFDYWGCSRYKYPVTTDEKEKLVNGIEGKKTPMIQAKDIQLLFDVETIPTTGFDVDLKECVRCYNLPCTCDNKVNEQKKYNSNQLLEDLNNGTVNGVITPNPYNLKREDNLPILKKTEDLDCNYEYMDDVLIKKPKLDIVKFKEDGKKK